MAGDIVIRRAEIKDWEPAMELAWKTFLKFEAADYGEEGIRSFQNFVTDNGLRRMFILGKYRLFVASLGDKIIGMGSVRDKHHISLLFVDEKWHHGGVGGALIQTMQSHVKNECEDFQITVNAAPYAVEFYKGLGFHAQSDEMCRDGIRFTPMSKLL